MKRTLLKTSVFLLAFLTLPFSEANAQEWEQVLKLPCAYTCNVAPDGTLIASDYRIDGKGGISISTDQGATWKKTAAPDHSYSNFVVAGKYIFGIGIGGGVARSADNGQTWQWFSYLDLYEGADVPEQLRLTVNYGIAYHKNKLYLADFVYGGVVYSEDFGETWKKTSYDIMMIDDGKGGKGKA